MVVPIAAIGWVYYLLPVFNGFGFDGGKLFGAVGNRKAEAFKIEGFGNKFAVNFAVAGGIYFIPGPSPVTTGLTTGEGCGSRKVGDDLQFF